MSTQVKGIILVMGTLLLLLTGLNFHLWRYVLNESNNPVVSDTTEPKKTALDKEDQPLAEAKAEELDFEDKTIEDYDLMGFDLIRKFKQHSSADGTKTWIAHAVLIDSNPLDLYLVIDHEKQTVQMRMVNKYSGETPLNFQDVTIDNDGKINKFTIPVGERTDSIISEDLMSEEHDGKFIPDINALYTLSSAEKVVITLGATEEDGGKSVEYIISQEQKDAIKNVVDLYVFLTK